MLLQYKIITAVSIFLGCSILLGQLSIEYVMDSNEQKVVGRYSTRKWDGHDTV